MDMAPIDEFIKRLTELLVAATAAAKLAFVCWRGWSESQERKAKPRNPSDVQMGYAKQGKVDYRE